MGRPAYSVHATRSGAWWAIEVPEIKGVHSQARRLDQVEAMAREAIALVLDVREDSFDLIISHTVPVEWNTTIARVREAQRAFEAARANLGFALRESVRELQKAGLPLRDVGSLMGMSAQRVSQLLDDEPGKRRGPRIPGPPAKRAAGTAFSGRIKVAKKSAKKASR